VGDSIWKKELSFSRKGKSEDAEPKAPKTPKAEKPKGESFWKKDISIGKKRVPAPADEVAAVAEAAPAEAPAAQSEEYSWLTASLDQQVVASPVVAEAPTGELPAPVPAAPVPAAPVPAAPAPVAPAPVAPAPVMPVQPGAMPSISVSLPSVAPAAPVMPVAPVAATPPPVAPAAPAVPAVPVAPPVAPAAVAGGMPAVPYTPPPAVPVPAPVAIEDVLPIVADSEPEVAPAPEPEPEAEAKVPFWKKEIGGKKKAKAEKAPKEKKVKAEKGDSVPFWKKELGKPKAEKQPRAPKQPKAEKAPKEKGEKTPFWKLEVGGKKKKDADFDTPKAKKQKVGKAPKAPKTLAKSSVVGLKIGASQIAAARVQNGDEPQLVQLARETLDEGIVVGGELRDLEALAETLKQFFAKHKLPKKGVRLGIANNRIGVRTFDIAGIDDPKQLANAIRFRAQETLPIPLEEAALDWQVLSETTDPETGQMTRRVLLVVAYRELVDRYIAACKKAGIRLAGIDLEAFAMLRALNAPLPADAPPAVGAQVVVNVGHDRSTFAVSDGRVCEFTRVLGWGGSALAVAIARGLDVTPSEATPLLHALSLVAEAETPEGFAPETVGAAREAVRRELQSFARELVSSLRFYQNQPGSLGIGGLVLTGGTAHLPGFTAELERLIGVPVTVGDPLARVRVPKKFREPERVGSLSVAIGLGIED
jgi:type IV pilus assembly protein PilM